MSAEQVSEALQSLPKWTLLETQGVIRITRKYPFDHYIAAVNFVVAVAELAEQSDHHPELHLAWGVVTATWWSHSVQGVQSIDCELARKCDLLYETRAHGY